CTNPAPSCGGANCSGPSTDTQSCNPQICLAIVSYEWYCGSDWQRIRFSGGETYNPSLNKSCKNAAGTPVKCNSWETGTLTLNVNTVYTITETKGNWGVNIFIIDGVTIWSDHAKTGHPNEASWTYTSPAD
ncbi:thrombospondin type-1 domain-containing protein, partial [Candidatus Parcubacteria bacterium]|nr:thrombospondin type-1 domain-containing protein [Candidatus Parcubacteria bacterium]